MQSNQEKAKQTIVDITPEELKKSLEPKVRPLEIVIGVATVGVFLATRRQLKVAKKTYNMLDTVFKNYDANILNVQGIISELKAAGKDFDFYPGVGVWVNK